MERNVKVGLAAAAALAGLAMAAPASAFPLGGAAGQLTAAPVVNARIDEVRWVCGPYRCFWRPNYYGYYRPRPFIGGYYGGWHRGWHGGGWGGGWHGGGWHGGGWHHRYGW